MPEFYKISFGTDELEALRRACARQSGLEDRMLDEAASGSLEGVVTQESRADDMLLIKSTVSIFKPGQTILITKEDLLLIRKCLENLKEDAGPVDNAIKKIDAVLQHPV